MKLIDAIRNVSRPDSKTPWDFSVDCDGVNRSLNITDPYYYPDALMERFKSYPIYSWNCTDEHVGLHALYLDDVAVGSYYKASRKGEAEVEWLSIDDATKVRNTILEYAEVPAIQLIDPDEDIGEDFAVSYARSALTDEGMFEGRPVRALVWYDYGHPTPEQYRKEGRSYVETADKDAGRPPNHVKVQDGDEQRIIPDDQFRMAFNLKVGVPEL
jgi:hypothetical protein